MNQFQAYGDDSRYMLSAASAAPNVRATFLKNVYMHLFGAVVACTGLTAFVAIVMSYFLGAGLGPWFAAAMIVVASGYILYDTSRIMKEYPADAYVGASLALFTSIATLFWYVIRLLMQLRNAD